jgi:hypothetical protein
MRTSKQLLITLICLLSTQVLFAQQTPAPVTYPRITGHFGIVHPIVTFDKDGTHTNFGSSYTVGVPIGINIWKTEKVGFSFEVVSYIRGENGVSKASNILIHPGILTALGNGYTFTERLAFETSGRYGFTSIFSKIIKRNKYTNYYIALPLPVRLGNDKPASVGLGLQLGISF